MPSLTSLPTYVGVLVDANEVGQAGSVATLYMHLDDDLHRRLRVAAAMNDETIKSLVARAVEREVERIEAEAGPRRR